MNRLCLFPSTAVNTALTFHFGVVKCVKFDREKAQKFVFRLNLIETRAITMRKSGQKVGVA